MQSALLGPKLILELITIRYQRRRGSNIAKPPIQAIEALGADVSKMYIILNDGPDIAVALVSAAYIDQALGSMILRKLVESPVATDLLNRALGDFAVRIDLAYSLGLINRPIRLDLLLINRIRNEFAHGHLETTFNNQQIQNWCGNLNSLRAMGLKLPDISNSARIKYTVTVALLANNLLLDAMSIERISENKDWLRPDWSQRPGPVDSAKTS